MKNIIIGFAAFAAVFTTITSGAQSQDLEPTCLEQLQKVSPGISGDLECLLEKVNVPFQKLCAADGVLATKEFRTYLILRDRYFKTQVDAEKWLTENPGSSKLSSQMAAKIDNAETAWMVGGKRSEYNDYIETVRRKSVSCH